MKFYAGIGSRAVSYQMMGVITEIAGTLNDCGYVLRSGGANGCDTAFEKGSYLKEIYLPWEGFNCHKEGICPPTEKAYELAERFHPAWKRLNDTTRKLMARNSHQIFGYDFKVRSEFVVCWTPDGCEDGFSTTKDTGGTGQALRIASAFDIPIFNLKNKDAIDRLFVFLEKNDVSSN